MKIDFALFKEKRKSPSDFENPNSEFSIGWMLEKKNSPDDMPVHWGASGLNLEIVPKDDQLLFRQYLSHFSQGFLCPFINYFTINLQEY